MPNGFLIWPSSGAATTENATSDMRNDRTGQDCIVPDRGFAGSLGHNLGPLVSE
jgi:hypothetical protein